MIVLDPLIDKIHNYLIDGTSSPLNSALLRFGTEDDVNSIINNIKAYENISTDRRYAFINLTPFLRIGHLNELITRLNLIIKPRPVLMVMSDIIQQNIRAEFENLPIIVANYSDSGDLIGINGGSTPEDNNYEDAIYKDLFVSDNKPHLQIFRRWIAQQNLIKILYNPFCLDIPNLYDEKPIYNISGKVYRVMPNNMLVSCYINVKEIGKDLYAFTKVAYEIILELVDNFRRDIDSLNDFDLIIAPNNTALFIASCVQAIIEKPVIAIDKLGPIPALLSNKTYLKDLLDRKKVIVIEEVIATGNEVDRTILFLHHMRAEVKKVIAVYNLEVGMPMLVPKGQLISICKPKEELNYVYRSQ